MVKGYVPLDTVEGEVGPTQPGTGGELVKGYVPLDTVEGEVGPTQPGTGGGGGGELVRVMFL